MRIDVERSSGKWGEEYDVSILLVNLVDQLHHQFLAWSDATGGTLSSDKKNLGDLMHQNYNWATRHAIVEGSGLV